MKAFLYNTNGQIIAAADWEPCPGLENVVQRFICKTPALGVAYQVLREEWDYDEDGMARRTIYEVRLIDGRDGA